MGATSASVESVDSVDFVEGGVCPWQGLAMNEKHINDFFDLAVLYLLGEKLPELPEHHGSVMRHTAPPPDGHDVGDAREASYDRALQFAAGIADRKHWRHRT